MCVIHGHDHHDHRDHLALAKNRLGDASLRCTRQRVLVYATLLSMMEHPTAEQLHARVTTSDPSVSLATIYNTLETLVEQGLARRVGQRARGSGACRYDADLEPHLHLVRGDGRVVDVPEHLGRTLMARLDPALLRDIADSTGVRGIRLELVEESDAAPTR